MPAPSEMLVIFRLSGLRLALPADCLAEIVLEPRLVRPPAAPEVVAGIMDLRGSMVPVVRLDRLLSLPPPARGAFRPLLVLSRPPPAPWAFLVEAVEDAAMAELSPVPPDLAFDDCVSAAMPTSEGVVAVLAPERLLRRRESQALEEFRDHAAARLEEFRLADP